MITKKTTAWVVVAAFSLALLGGRIVYHAGLENLPIVKALDAGRNKANQQYMGRTSASYNGNLGGIAGANAKCQLSYSGSHMCTQGEMLQSGATDFEGNGWAACNLRIVVPGPTGFEQSTCSGTTFNEQTQDSSTDWTCGQWSSNNHLAFGAYIDSTGQGHSSSCALSRQIHCCK